MLFHSCDGLEEASTGILVLNFTIGAFFTILTTTTSLYFIRKFSLRSDEMKNISKMYRYSSIIALALLALCVILVYVLMICIQICPDWYVHEAENDDHDHDHEEIEHSFGVQFVEILGFSGLVSYVVGFVILYWIFTDRVVRSFQDSYFAVSKKIRYFFQLFIILQIGLLFAFCIAFGVAHADAAHTTLPIIFIWCVFGVYIIGAFGATIVFVQKLRKVSIMMIKTNMNVNSVEIQSPHTPQSPQTPQTPPSPDSPPHSPYSTNPPNDNPTLGGQTVHSDSNMDIDIDINKMKKKPQRKRSSKKISTLTKMDKKNASLLNLTVKFSILMGVALLSTLTSSLTWLVVWYLHSDDGSTDLTLYSSIYCLILTMFDAFVNIVCLALQFHANNHFYMQICSKCDKCLRQVYTINEIHV